MSAFASRRRRWRWRWFPCAVGAAAAALCVALPAAAPRAAGEGAAPGVGAADAPLLERRPRPQQRTYPRPVVWEGVAPRVGAAPRRDWTVLLFVDADSAQGELELAALHAAGSVGSTRRVNLLALVDRHGAGGASLVYLAGDGDGRRPGSRVLADLREPDMADPQTLVAFVAWGLRTFPAERVALVVAGPGDGWRGMLNDETNAPAGAPLSGPVAALEALKEGGAPKLDLVVFDVSGSGHLEVMQALAPFASFAVASPALKTGRGLPHRAALGRLAAEPQMTPRQLSEAYVEAARAAGASGGPPTASCVAVDLARVGELTSALDEVAGALIKAPLAVSRAVGRARAAAERYPRVAGFETDARDLGDFAARLGLAPEAAPFGGELRRLSDALGLTVVGHAAGAAHRGSTGLAVYFPFDKNVDPGYEATPLARTRWARYLLEGGQGTAGDAAVRIAAATRAGAPVAASALSVTATVSATPAAVRAGLGYRDRDGNVTLLAEEEVAAPAGGWTDGASFTLTALPRVRAISDGVRSVIAPLTPFGPGAPFDAASASFHSVLGDMRAVGVFDARSGGLAAVLGRGRAWTGSPVAVSPLGGERLVFYRTVLAGENRPPAFRPAAAVAAKGLRLVEAALPPGDYLLVLAAYGFDGRPSGYDLLAVRAGGRGGDAAGAVAPGERAAIAEEDLEDVDLRRLVASTEYGRFEAGFEARPEEGAGHAAAAAGPALEERDLRFDATGWADEFPAAAPAEGGGAGAVPEDWYRDGGGDADGDAAPEDGGEVPPR